MFGQQNDDQNKTDAAAIPEQSIDGVLNDQPAPAAASSWQHPGAPLNDDGSTAPVTPVEITPPVEPVTAAPTTAWDTSTPVPAESIPDSLVDIKLQALGQLAPLVNHLDQSPEEKFRTTMMLIQASDNQSLVKDAYAAAQTIPDEKARAQALLDIVNEINYFTQAQGE